LEVRFEGEESSRSGTILSSFDPKIIRLFVIVVLRDARLNAFLKDVDFAILSPQS
jgi:hypothetical protein